MSMSITSPSSPRVLSLSSLLVAVLCAASMVTTALGYDRLRNFSTNEELGAILALEPEVATVVGYFDVYSDEDSFEAFRLVSRGEGARANFAATTNKKLLAEVSKESCAVVLHLPVRDSSTSYTFD
jgi:hypothetical protein